MDATPKPTHGGLRSVTGVVLAAVLFVAVNVLAGASLTGARFDLTQDRLFTLSDGTRTVLSRIDEPLVFRLFLSERLTRTVPQYAEFGRRVEDMLVEFANASDGKVVLQVIDPLPFSADEDLAVALGVQGVPLDQQGELVYFGLAASNSTDDSQVIPFFQPSREPFLEYDLARMTAYLSNPKRTVVGLISDLPMEGDFRAAMMGQGQPTPPFRLVEEMREVFDVRGLSGAIDGIPEDVDVLLVAYPSALPEKTKYAIDQFFLRGGNGVIFLDPNAEGEMTAAARLRQPPGEASADFAELLDGWGVTLVPGQVVGDRSLARRVNAGGAGQVRAADYVAWLKVGPENMNPDDPITANLEVLHMATAGALEHADGSPLAFEPLVFTSEGQSAFVAREQVRATPDVVGILRSFEPDGAAKVIAARVRGEVPTAFPDGPPEEMAEVDDAPEHLAAAVAPANVVIVADTDMLQDAMWVSTQNFFGRQLAIPTADNASFVINALENLSGDDALIGLRSRGVSTRPFETLQRMELAAQQRLQGTERQLTAQLEELEQKLSEARSAESQLEGGAGRRLVLDEEQQQAVESFQAQLIAVRQQLRDVQRALREDIERLELTLTFVNIALVPALVIVLAVAVWAARSARRRRAAVAARAGVS